MKTAKFITRNYHNFNAGVVKNASIGWENLLKYNGKMVLAMAGAMSTAKIGISLAELIRKNKIHAICTTGANLEEDLFNLIEGDYYTKLNYENLSLQDETKLENRVLDTCIPESVMREVENYILPLWTTAERQNKSYFPHEYFYKILDSHFLKDSASSKDSWLVAAKDKNIPLFIPGWEDSTIGNVFVAEVVKGRFKSYNIIKSGLQYMESLIKWYGKNDDHNIGLIQIGGGIAGDFVICSVPLINQDLNDPKAKDKKQFPSPISKVDYWSYFCQITDSTTSYGSYSGASCKEKITWGKLKPNCKNLFNINSDATIVFPLMANYILGK